MLAMLLLHAAVLGRLCAVLVEAAHSGAAGQAHQHALFSAWEGEEAKPSPVKRVIQLLTEMKGQLEKASSADADAYDKMVCWCTTNDKDKTTAVAEADAAITELLSEVESRSARAGELATRIEQVKKDLAEKKAALATAIALREKEYAEFSKEEKEMVDAVTMLKNAIFVLSRHHAGFLQMTAAMRESLGSVLRWVALKHEELLEMRSAGSAFRGADRSKAEVSALLSVATHTSLDAELLGALRGSPSPGVQLHVPLAAKALALLAHKGTSFTQQMNQPAHLQRYAPQSGQIFGILKEMQETFEANLSEAQKQELKAQEEHSSLKAASEAQITASAAALDETQTEHAANTKALSDAEEVLVDTRATRAADVKFLTDLKLECQDLDHQFAQRSHARSEELRAVTDTISILSADDARELFHKKLGAVDATYAFVQLAGSSAARGRAAAAARSAASRALLQVKPSERLAMIAVQVQLDAFVKVKQSIDTMVADLKSQQEVEVKKKALCVKELGENEKQTYTTRQALADLEDKIAALEDTMQKLTDEIALARKEISEMEVQTKKAGEDRKKENQRFQEEVSDQRAMQAILKKAIDRMKFVYKQQAPPALAQEEPVSPEKFQPYRQHAGAPKAVALLETIVADSAAVERDAVASEQVSQKAYEALVADANAVIRSLTAAIASKSGAISAAKLDQEEAEAQRRSAEELLGNLAAYHGDLLHRCSFLLKNFDTRQLARQQEIKALQDAKAFLSGMVDGDGAREPPASS